MSLDATGRLFAETLALRIVLQRVLAQLASNAGVFEEILRIEHDRAIDDLRRTTINDGDPDRAAAIRIHAETVIDQMHTNMRLGRPPK